MGCTNFAVSLSAGQLTSRLSEDTELMARTVCLNANVILRTFVKTMGTVYFMSCLSWKLTLLVLMETPFTAVLQKVYSAYDLVQTEPEGPCGGSFLLLMSNLHVLCPVQRLSLELQNSLAEAREAVTEVVSGIHVVQSFNAEKHEARRYGNLLKDMSTLKIRQKTAEAAYLIAKRVSFINTQNGGDNSTSVMCFVSVTSSTCS